MTFLYCATLSLQHHDVEKRYHTTVSLQSHFDVNSDYNDSYVLVRGNMYLLSHVAECNMGNIFRVSQILQLIQRAFRRVK